MSVGSLFSGIGGLELGLEACGFGPVLWQCDSDPMARLVLEAHWPGVKRYDDVRAIDGKAACVDVVCGGFPCQPHSVAGKRAGEGDSRWLWPAFAAVIAAVKPAVVFIENVPGLRSSGMSAVLAGLAGLGFDAQWDCFSAGAVGAPHIRRRLFILAHANGVDLRNELRRSGRENRKEAPFPGIACPPWVVADANCARGLESQGSVSQQWRWTRDGDGWSVESPVSGVAHGIPRRLDRHRLTGNACSPQQAAHAFKSLAARAVA